MTIFFSLASGLLIGLISGLVGIGGGAIMVPLFVLSFKMSMYKAVGTSLAIIAPITLVGAISHHTKGNVELGPVVAIALAAMVGMFISGQVIEYVPQVLLKRVFAVILIVIAVKLVMK